MVLLFIDYQDDRKLKQNKDRGWNERKDFIKTFLPFLCLSFVFQKML